jgi:hypothetical protein
MKVLSIALLLLSSFVFADTTDTRQVRINNDGPSTIVELLTEKTRTELRTVTVNTMCSRTEYRYQCHNRAPYCQTQCRYGYCQRVCHPGGRVCQNIPVQVNYPCQRTQTREVEVLDHYVNTTVKLNFDFGDNEVNENLTLVATGNTLTAKSQTQNFAVYLTDKHIRTSSQGETVYKDIDLDIKFVNANSVNNVMRDGIKGVSLRNGILSFEVNRDFNFKDFVQNIKLYQDRRGMGDIFLAQKDLRRNDLLDVQVNGNKKIMSLDVSSVIRSTPDRLRVILTTQFTPLNYTLLNPDSLQMSTSANWLFY